MIKIDVSKLSYTKETTIEEVVNFDPEIYKCYPPLLEVKEAKINAKIARYQDFIYININVKAKVVLQCSYTLKPFETILKDKDELHFASYVDENDDDLIIYKGNFIELDKYIFDIISASVPLSPKSPGATLPKDGEGYRLISDEELKVEKEEQGDPRFDALKNLEFDD